MRSEPLAFCRSIGPRRKHKHGVVPRRRPPGIRITGGAVSAACTFYLGRKQVWCYHGMRCEQRRTLSPFLYTIGGVSITICIFRRGCVDHKTKGVGRHTELSQIRGEGWGQKLSITEATMWGMARIDEWKPVIAMLVFDLISAVTTALIKKALQEGLDRLVLITLRQLVATVFLAPIAYFKERRTRPKLTLEILVYLFFSAAFGAALSQYTFFYGLQYTTATFAITFTNMAPVLTFLIAVLLRVESLNMKNKAGAAKIAGTLMAFAGVMLLTVYKGVALTHQVEPSVSPDHHAAATAESSKKSWTLGTIALLANCLCFSFWLLLQSRLTKKYPALYSSTAYMFLISSLQGGGLTAAIQRRASVWIVTRPVEIVTVLYTGVMGSGVGYVLMTWCVEKRGPVFTSAFIPVIQIMVAMIDFFFLHENIYLGSVLGSILMILGLYILLWGKKRDASEASSAKEEEEEDKEKQVKSRGSSQTIPFSKTNHEDQKAHSLDCDT